MARLNPCPDTTLIANAGVTSAAEAANCLMSEPQA